MTKTLKMRLSDVDKMIGHAVRTMRVRKNMSQEALATQLGITFQQVQKYEKGTNRVAASTLREICTVLGCGISDILPPIGQTADLSIPCAEAMKAQSLIEAMPPASRQAAIRVLRAMEAGVE